VAAWLRDKELTILLRFRLQDDEFQLSGVDFNLLTQITPARAKRVVERTDSVQSADEAPSQSIPPESSSSNEERPNRSKSSRPRPEKADEYA
jgi:hypothetical protein